MIFRVRPIPSCPGYFASDTGRAWGPKKELTPHQHGWHRGHYWWLYIYVNGRRRERLIHQLVAEAFLGPKPAGRMVCHRNDKPEDNRLGNLYYGTARTNSLDCYRNGHQSRLCGERNPSAKLTWKAVRAIRRKYAAGGVTQAQLGRDYGVRHNTIWDIVHNVKWKTPDPLRAHARTIAGEAQQ